MKIILDIPDNIVEDLKDRNLRLFAGIELIAEKTRGDKWKVKTKGCSMCGECCKNLPKEHPFPVIDGRCIYLKRIPGHGNKLLCILGVNRPFGCAIANPDSKNCRVEYKYIEEQEEE